jgi:Concanavalin A-like lectin/glucanases superfamily/FecR protein
MDHAEFDLLVDRHLDGGLDLAGQDRLEALLRSDASLRTRFWELARIHGQIAWVSQERHADLPTNEAVTAERALRDSSTHTPAQRSTQRTAKPPRQPSIRRWRHALPTTLAAGLLVVGGFAWLTSSQSAPIGASTDAVIVDLAEVRWQDGSGPAIGDAVGNRPLRLAAGLAQVRFASGATVIVQGPATFTAHSARGGKLDLGSVVARVPESAKGFTIESASARVVDLGTEFGFSAENNTTQDVQVFDGLVQVFATRSPVELPQALHRGEAVRVDDRGAIVSTAFNAQRFIRVMPAELTSPALMKGLVAWWKLDETSGTVVRDASGNGHDGVLQQATLDQAHVPGMVGGALRFPDRGFIEVPDHQRFHLVEMTLHAWVRPDPNQRIDAQIISKQGSYGLAMPRNEAMKFYFWHMDRVIDRPFPVGRWVNLCATFDGAMRRFYVDGVRIGSITSPTPPVTENPIRLGALEGLSRDVDRFFQGAIDEVRVYGRALSDDEVRLLHLQAKPR